MLLLLLGSDLGGSLPDSFERSWDTLFDVSHVSIVAQELTWLGDQLSQVIEMERVSQEMNNETGEEGKQS